MRKNVTRCAAVATAYLLAGQLVSMLAVDPGYAMPLWPSAGLALAVVILFGHALWPGIFIGSFLTNLAIAWRAATLAPSPDSLILPAVIALGATGQALLGAILVQRWGRVSGEHWRTREVLTLLGLGGPVASIVSASFGVSALQVFGVIKADDYVYNWWNWWVGDCMGVLVVAPMIFIWANGLKTKRWREALVASIPLAAVFAGSVAMLLLVNSWERRRLDLEFEKKTDTLVQALQRELDHYREILYSLRSVLNAEVKLDRERFRVFAEDYLTRFPELQGLSWNPLVLDSQRESFEAGARAEGYPSFQITEKNARGELVRAARRPNYVSVRYLEPYARNKLALGYDVSSDPVRDRAMAYAIATGGPAITGPIKLVQDTNQRLGFLYFVPVYKLAQGADGARKREPLGYATGVFRYDAIVAAGMDASELDDVVIKIRDLEPLTEGTVAYDSTATGVVTPTMSGSWIPRRSRVVEVGGRRLVFDFARTTKYLHAQRHWYIWSTLATGAVITGLLGAFILVSLGRTAEIESRVLQPTGELQQLNVQLSQEIEDRKKTALQLARSESRLRTMVDSEPESVSLLARDGSVIEINPAGLAMMEADALEQIAGASLLPRIIATHRPAFQALVDRAFMGQRAKLEYEMQGLKGAHRWLECHAAPLFDDGEVVVGCLTITRDITERKRLENEVLEVSDQERRRVGHDLHDDVGQTLTGVALLLKGLERKLSLKSPAELQDIMRITELVKKAITRIREIVHGLVPVEPVDGALEGALQRLAAKTETLFNIGCTVDVSKGFDVVDRRVATQLYRIVQEALANAVKHSRAKSVRISLSRSPDGYLTLIISDDGDGFPDVIPEPQGFGLQIMKYRSERIGGELSVKRGLLGGTLVTCALVDPEARRLDA